MLFLQYCCRDRAKLAIQDCVVLPSDRAYSRAKQILKDLYGEKHVIARARIDQLMMSLEPVGDDGEALTLLALELQNCQIALSELQYTADLEAVTTIEKIIRVLPVAIKRNWALWADTRTQMGLEPGFNDLCQFVAKEARVARSRYGALVNENPNRMDRVITSKSHKLGDTPRNTFATSRIENKVCILCRSVHKLSLCNQFLAMSVTQRWSTVRRNRLCYLCMESGHQVKDCMTGSKCNSMDCQKRHHSLLHMEIDKAVIQKGTCAIAQSSPAIMLCLVPVKIKGPEKEIETYAFLDNGSDVTLVTEDLLLNLGIEGTPSSMSITTINGTSEIRCQLSELEVASIDGRRSLKVDRAFVVPSLPIKAPAVSITEEARRWPHLRDIPFVESNERRVKILIGGDIPEAHWILEQRLGGRKDPYAFRTPLGWVLFGSSSRLDHLATVNCTRGEMEIIRDDIRKLYEAEFTDTEDKECSLSLDDCKAIELVSKSVILEDGHYVIPLPWKDPRKIEDSNLVVARNRLRSLKHRLLRDQNLHARYTLSMNSMLEKGYAVPVPVDQLGHDYRPKGYLPHHPVINPKKPEKLRIVLDCAATFNGYSLNDKLYQGPDTTAELIGVLIRFREKPIAVVADIADMFMQVKVPPGDRSAVRFLWWENGRLGSKPREFQMTAHPFGATSSPFCANFALRKTVEDFWVSYTNVVHDIIKHNFYVDDCLARFTNVEDAKRFVVAASDMLSHAGFRLHKWISNRDEVLKSVTPERKHSSRLIDGHSSFVERTLGLEWNSLTDSFVFPFRIPIKSVTRRGILSAISSIFDPLGIICPLLLPAKLILQALCKRKMDWDQLLSCEDEKAWLDWISAMERIDELKIPRCITPSIPNEGLIQQLHLFCDASEVGYGAAAYVRTQTHLDNIYCNLLLAKARVTPLKSITIPRLELAAAVLATRLYQIISRNVTTKFESVYFWTDSMTVLYYIRNESTRFSTYVANRLTIIRQYSRFEQWNHVPSNENTADLASRGTLNLEHLQRWFEGPNFLRGSQDHWPKSDLQCDPDKIELKRQAAMVNRIAQPECITTLLRRYSKWMTLVKSVSWVLRLKTYLLVKLKGYPMESLAVGLLKVSETRRATHEIVRLVQSEVYYEMLHKPGNLDSCEGNGSFPLSLRRLCPVMKDGILCVGGRLTYADIPGAAKNPAILPSKHVVTDLLIHHYHVLEGHRGIHHVIASIRRSFWIVKGVAAVKRVIGRCVECRRRSTIMCKQLMAPLPMARVEEGWYPFRSVGIDFFGPFFVKRGRGKEKRYGCLFTCLQIRAVHLEVAHSLSTDSFVMTLLRFIARRGIPANIYSDNGTNFVGACRELREQMNSWNQKKINEVMLSRNIQWHFQPPDASHRGGVWERMIRSVRNILSAIGNEQSLTDETLLTFMGEAERILNGRPIVPVTSDSKDDLALTPNHLLLLRGNSDFESDDDISARYHSGWKQAKHLAASFWRRWTREYLPLLQTRQKWILRSRNLRPGDVVMIVSDSAAPGRWPLGIILECESSEDGLVRTVRIRTKGGEVRRDIRKVCLLEGSD